MWNVMKKNKVASFLLLTILLGVISTAFNFPEERFLHPSGKEGHYLNYYIYFNTQYILGFILVGIIISLTKGVNRVVGICYLFWDFVGFLLYQYNGWPEPKILIILAFSTTLITYIILSRNVN